MDRRHFLRLGAAASAITVIPAHVWAGSPNSKFRIAHIGVWGMGQWDMNDTMTHPMLEVAALVDVDSESMANAAKRFPNAKQFKDYREMLVVMGDQIDGVMISAPDHVHAPASMLAMNHNLPVYCQKPLSHDIFEARKLREKYEQTGLVTQMGIQIHSHTAYATAVKWVQDGMIGKVKRVHAWSNKNWGDDRLVIEGSDPVPETLDWDLWLGVAADRPYVKNAYHRENWRKLIDFGSGTLGDMGIHIFDTPFTALELDTPLWVKTACREPNGLSHPEGNIVQFIYPGTKYTSKTMEWNWYDGINAPYQVNNKNYTRTPIHKDLILPEGHFLPEQGAMFVGENGERLLLPHWTHPLLIDKEGKTMTRPDLPKIKTVNHYHQWIDACRGDAKTSAPFDLSGKLTESMLLGVVANRFPGQKLNWDGANMKVTNLPEANKLLKRDYRKGWEIEGL
ncbi:MAG: Gfo/Idh/MocA family oxidoreductase [Bacteroidota bacterium]